MKILVVLIIICALLIIVPKLRATHSAAPQAGATFEGGSKESYTYNHHIRGRAASRSHIRGRAASRSHIRGRSESASHIRGRRQKGVYLTMTTLPERVKTSWFYNNLVKNIAAASKNNFTLILNIPEISGKTGKPYDIPENIQRLVYPNSHFLINYTEKDEGPITKLLPTLRNPLVKSNDIIIVCDDDIVYKENVFEMIYLSVQRRPQSVSAMCNVKIEGFKTFGFKKKTLEPLLSMSIPKSCFRIDDDVIQFFIDSRRIPIVAVPYLSDTEWNCSIHFEESENHPKWEELKNDDRKPMQARCLNELKRKQA